MLAAAEVVGEDSAALLATPSSRANGSSKLCALANNAHSQLGVAPRCAVLPRGLHPFCRYSPAAPSRTNCLPMLPPDSMLLSAVGACSKPSATVSRHFR